MLPRDSRGGRVIRLAGELSYVDKSDESTWWIVAIDPATGIRRTIIDTLPGAEDFVWTREGSLLMSDGTQLYMLDEGGITWRHIRDLSTVVDGQVNRLALSSDGRQLALVAVRSADEG